MTSPNQGQLDLMRRYPKVADATGAGAGQPPAQPSTGGGALVAPAIALPSAGSANWTPGNWQQTQQPAATGAAATATTMPTQGPSFSPTQTAALSQQDPNFLLNYYSRPQTNAQPAPTSTALTQPASTSNVPQEPGLMGSPWQPASTNSGAPGSLPGGLTPITGGNASSNSAGVPQNQLPGIPGQLSANANLQYPQLQNIIGYGAYSQPGYGV